MYRFIVALMVCGVLAVPSVAQAQLPFSFGIAGGPNFSQDADEMGYHVGGVVDISLPLLPVGFRVDGAMNRFDFANTPTRIFDVTANVMYSPLPLPMVKPYFIGGVGFYSTRIKDTPAADEMGVNAGAGVKLNLLALKVFVDARYHYVFNEGEALKFIPVSIGIMF